MKFATQERQALLAVKGVGPTVISRLEQIGISSLSDLRRHSVDEITASVAKMLDTTCWKNSPQAKQAIQNAIDCAHKAEVGPNEH
ncbi:MAG: hypothetical protein WBD31_18070 [Rubripirellula sp.]